MKKMNKKGFTLIELLAVIVILAIIMVIAVPQILKVINSSKTSAWDDSVKLIEKSIELNSNLPMGGTTMATLCQSDATNAVKAIADVGDMTIACSSNTFTLTGTGQFNGKGGKIACNANGNCNSCSGGTSCSATAPSN